VGRAELFHALNAGNDMLSYVKLKEMCKVFRTLEENQKVYIDILTYLTNKKVIKHAIT